jgi:hypothetical protein
MEIQVLIIYAGVDPIQYDFLLRFPHTHANQV